VRFSADGRSLAAICHDVGATLSVWSLDGASPGEGATGREVAERREVVRHLEEGFACRLQSDGALGFHLDWLARQRLTNAWELTGRGELYAIRGQWEQADTDFRRALALRPGDAGLCFGCGWFYLRHGRQKEAAGWYAQGFARQAPVDPHLWFQHAELLLAARDAPGYRNLCQRMVEQFGRSEDSHAVLVTAWACSLAPGGVEPQQVLKLARLAAAADRHSAWCPHALGTAYSRAEEFERAAAQFHESLKADPAWPGNFTNWLWLAMTYQRLGQSEAARAALEQARADYEKALAGWSASMPVRLPLHPHEWLEWQVILPEAKLLLPREGR